MDDTTDTRSDIAAAFDAAEQATPEPVAVEAAPEPAPTPADVAGPDIIASPEPVGVKVGKDGKPRAPDGKFAKIGDPAPKVEEPPKVEAAAPTPEAPAPVQPKAEVHAPRSLPAPLREAWKKLDQTEREYLLKREGEVARVHTEAVQHRQVAEKFREVVTPYEHMFRAEGVEPLQGIGNLMRTTAALATGPQQTKAQIVAGIIKTYGVDISMLDSLLSGQQLPPSTTQPQVDPNWVDQRAAQVVEQRFAQIQREAAERKAQAQYQEFVADPPEFFTDLQDDMRKLLEAGIATDFKDAYNKASVLNPAISRIVEQRRAAASQSGSTQRAVAAASSVRGQPASVAAAPSNGNTADDVARAWSALESRK